MQAIFEWVRARCKTREPESPEDPARERDALACHCDARVSQSFKNAQHLIELRRTRVFQEADSLGRRPGPEEALAPEDPEQPREPPEPELAPAPRASLEAAEASYRARLQALSGAALARLKGSVEYEDLCCPICISELVNPHLTNCGHLFCHDCISTYLLTSKKCPICRAQIKRKKVAPLENMAQTIELLSEDADKPARLRSYLQWREQTAVQEPVRPGDLLDVRDTLYVWCVGEVKEVLKSPFGRPKTLLIHYRGWNSIYDEFIAADSYRLAPLGTYSSRADLPKYLQNHREERRDPASQLNPLLDLMQLMPR